MKTYKTGDIAYFIESRKYIREGKLTHTGGDLYLFRFVEGGGTRIRENRLYPTEEAAQAALDRLRGIDPRKRLAFFV